MDKADVVTIIVLLFICVTTSWAMTSDYYKKQMSAKTNEYERAVRQAAYNKTHLCLDNGTFYEVKIYRMDGNMEFYIVKPIK